MAIVTARQTPWAEIGHDVSGLMTADEALVKAGLDWTVEKRPALTYAGDGSTVIVVPGQVANVRVEDDTVMGITGDVHELVQNATAFAWGDSIVADKRGRWERAGDFRGGRVVFMSMELPDHIALASGEEIAPYLLISNGHDGKRSLEAAITAVRVVCQNTLALALATAQQRITIRHATNVEERMSVAAEALGITYKYMAELEKVGKSLLAKKVTIKQAESVLRDVFPVPTSQEGDRLDQSEFSKALAVWKNSDDLDAIRKTGWGVLQAVAEYLDHEVEYKARRWSPGDTRFRNLVIGGSSIVKKQKAYAAIRAL